MAASYNSKPVVTKKATAKPTAKPVAKAKPKATPTRPAVGTDIAAKKKYGKASWNNGYTN